ncbi:hypothetical protein RSOLAG1IB_04027 [Rhizoctonia solani AG-1 IB]|uniref:Uncharacterized protein n=1 Tax=Thanatephorus cucumeris (strain AG1-IB / isolate 7/3/14) TaxID=1108050 RepID=A0A0B7FX33_THACB|nr:hypothetical protein RSOLAG1IB_04027 [Rhizoctonia solani AG-1 IB]
MRRSGGTPSRPSSSRSNQSTIYLSLISTKVDFLDTLLINPASGMPLYATITETGSTAVYAIDRSMELHKIVTINWSQGKKPNRTTLTSQTNETVLLSDVSTSNQSTLDSLMGNKKQIERNYLYGQFNSRWTAKSPESWYDSQSGIHYCYRDKPVPNSSEPTETPSTSRGDGLFATVTFCSPTGKPGIKIDLYSRECLYRTVREDGLTDMDHVILGALLSCTSGGRKRGKVPEGWLNEAQLQEHLRAQRQIYRTRSNETLPLYRARSSTHMESPPPYASRVSLQAHTFIRHPTS